MGSIIMKEKKLQRISPNWDHWYEPTLVREKKTTHESYHKEYMSYVEAFNKAVDESNPPVVVDIPTEPIASATTKGE